MEALKELIQDSTFRHVAIDCEVVRALTDVARERFYEALSNDDYTAIGMLYMVAANAVAEKYKEKQHEELFKATN